MPEAPSRKLPLPANAGPRSPIQAALLVLAVFYTLDLGQTFFFPIFLAGLLSILLRPLVRALGRLHVPEPLGAAVVLAAFLGVAAFGVLELREPALEWLEAAPRNFRQLERQVRELREPVEKMSEAAEQVEKMAEIAGDGGQPAQVEIKQPSLVETFLGGARNALASLLVTVFLLYLLLISGDLFLRKLVRVSPGFGSKRRTVRFARRAQDTITRYLVTITTINACLGLVVGLAMWLVGMPNPWLWAVLAGMLNFVPYLGATICASILLLVSLTTFTETGQILLPPALFVFLTALEGSLITPLILGRGFALNPVIVFAWIFLWGWMWGISGMLLAIPLLVSLKILCDHLPDLAWLGELLGR